MDVMDRRTGKRTNRERERERGGAGKRWTDGRNHEAISSLLSELATAICSQRFLSQPSPHPPPPDWNFWGQMGQLIWTAVFLPTTAAEGVYGCVCSFLSQLLGQN